MKCKVCKKEVVCKEHGSDCISEYQHNADGSFYYSCDKCVEQYCTAFGSIVHHCGGIIDLAESEQVIIIDGAR